MLRQQIYSNDENRVYTDKCRNTSDMLQRKLNTYKTLIAIYAWCYKTEKLPHLLCVLMHLLKSIIN